MAQTARPPGKTTIAPEVLLTIIRLTVLKVDGVYSLCPLPGSVNRLFLFGRKKEPQVNEGVKMDIKDDTVYADIYVILDKDNNVRDVCRNIQREVARAISQTVGMQIGRINIHVEDFEYPDLTQEEPQGVS